MSHQVRHQASQSQASAFDGRTTRWEPEDTQTELCAKFPQKRKKSIFISRPVYGAVEGEDPCGVGKVKPTEGGGKEREDLD